MELRLVCRKVLCALTASALFVSSPGAQAKDLASKPEADSNPAVTAAAGRVHDPLDLASLQPLVGTDIVVEGTIVKSGESKSGKVRYLNFTQDHWKALALIIFPENTILTPEVLARYVGEKVRVSGTLSEHRKHLQIIVEDPLQIELLAEATPPEYSSAGKE